MSILIDAGIMGALCRHFLLRFCRLVMQGSNAVTDNIALLRSKVRLIDVISEKIKLIKRGGSHYVGLCPFHSEKTPSFSVNCDNNLFYCFGCGATGDVIQFVSDTEGLDFKQAMITLAERYGVELIASKSEEEAPDSLCNIMEKATIWLSGRLQESKVALDYLRGRGITDSTIKRFRIGYVPSAGIKTYLLSIGIGVDRIRDVGLLSKGGQDCLYNRIIFPICNSIGKVISLGGRSLSSEHTPKYLNSAENALFKKRESMYGFHLALGTAKKLEKMIVVEGYVDVLILSQLGIHNAVGLLGTAMTEHHLRSIWAIVPEIIVWMDGDYAGLKAAVKIANLAMGIMQFGQSIRFVSGITGKDPYDVCMEKGADAVSSMLDDARLLSEFIWEYELSSSGIGASVVPEKCMALENKLKEYVAKIRDHRVSKYYRNFFYQQVKELQRERRKGAGISPYSSARTRTGPTSDRMKNISPKVCAEDSYQMRVLCTIVECPKLLDDAYIFEQFAGIDFYSNDRKILQQHIVDIKEGENIFSKQDLMQKLRARGGNLDKTLQDLLNTSASIGFSLSVLGLSEVALENRARQEWEKLMLSKQLSVIHEQIVKLKLEGKDDVAHKLSEHAREIDDKLRGSWLC